MELNHHHIKKIAQKHNLKLLILFGSQVTQNIHPESDIDIAFFADTKVDEEKLYEDLMALLRRADIDLINLYTHHDHLLRYQILSKGVALYEAEKGLMSKMEGDSYIDYMDFKKYDEIRSILLDKKLAEMTA